MKRATLRLSIIPFLSLLCFYSCGIPKTILLSPPVFSSNGANLLELTHNKENYDESEGLNQSFKGYEIFYRAHGSSTAAEADVLALQGYKENYEYNPGQFMNAALARGFIRIRRESPNTAPLVPITSAGNDAIVQIQIPSSLDAADWTLVSIYPIDSFLPVPVYRSISDTTRWNFFNKLNYLATDIVDYTGESSPASIYFVFFAVAYGEDPEAIGQDVYSLPDDMTILGNIISYP